jgi:CheY-like chemotaxis protein
VIFPARTELTTEQLDLAADREPSELLAGKRVLLVEDQADAREIVNAALQHYGVSVTNASSSREALAVLDTAVAARLPPDAIISDIGLPEEDGYRLMEQLSVRSKAQGGAIPVIAVTAYGRPQDKRRALAAGFRIHLTKPVTPAALASAVASVLAR